MMESRSSGKVRISEMRVRAKTTLPAPMRAILGMGFLLPKDYLFLDGGRIVMGSWVADQELHVAIQWGASRAVIATLRV